jgi:hypothetical protein
MKSYHWITIVVIVVVAYFAGANGWLMKAKSAVTSAGA